MIKLSIVTTLYQSSAYIEEFYQRASSAAYELVGEDYEIILVNDGSPDNSIDIAVRLHTKDEKIKIIDLSRNFGHHKAIMTGLSYSRGEYIFLIDVDLEEEPELLNEFWIKLHDNEKLDFVYGIQERRKGTWFEKKSGDIFYNVFNYFSEVKIPRNFLTVRLMKSNYVNSLIKFGEKELTFAVLVSLAGFNSEKLEVTKLSHSPTTYSFLKKMTILFNAVISSTAKPLWLIFNFGLFVTSSSIVYIVFLLYRKIFSGVQIDGWTSTIISIVFFGGIIIFFLGVIGLYLSKIFLEVKNRPFTIIKKIYEKEN